MAERVSTIEILMMSKYVSTVMLASILLDSFKESPTISETLPAINQPINIPRKSKEVPNRPLRIPQNTDIATHMIIITSSQFILARV